MDQYDASKDKKRRWRCGIRRIYFSTFGIIITTILITFLTHLLGSKFLGFIDEPNVDFRFGDICSHMRLIDHPVLSPKEGSRLLVVVHVDNMEQFGNAFDQIMLLIDRLRKAELRISLSINKGLDLAPLWIDMFQSLLKSKRIPFVYFYEGEKLALQPLWDRSYDASHVITIRSSFFCAEDILRLYWQIADPNSESSLACGLQFSYTRKRQLRLDFTDTTLRSLGLSPGVDPGYKETPVLKSILTGHTTQLECCWSNVAALAGDLLLSQPEQNGDCLGYDCQKICEMAKGAKLMPSVPVVPDQGTRSLIAVAPLHPQILPQAILEL